MKFFRLDLLTLLISLFIFNSCKNQDTIGLKPGSSGSLSGSLVDTATIFTNTLAEDSVATGSMTKLPLGLFNDPIFGQTESDLITDLNLPGSVAYTLPTGSTVIDSARLLLNYADGFYGDSSLASSYTVNVYQLAEKVYPGTTYYNSKKWQYNSNLLLGTKTFRPRPKDSIKVDSIIAGKPDTLVKIGPQLRIPIDPDFIYQNLFRANSATLASNLIFQNIVKGLFITMDKNQTTGIGGTIMMKAPGASSLAVYIRTSNGSVIDTSVVYLDVARHATQISHTYSQQVQNALAISAQNAQNHTNISDSLMYLQGTAGLKAKISFPYLSSLFSSLGGNVIINRAEIVVTAAPGSDIPAYLVPQPKLTLYRYDIAHTPIPVEDASSSSGAFFGVGQFGGFYNLSSRSYHFLVTGYIQDLVANRTKDYGTYIATVDTTNTSSVDIAPTAQTAGRVLAVGNNKKLSYGIKLNVIYTKPGK